jgi:hypothetical protein
MWLPHGLDAGVDTADLKPLITICQLAAAATRQTDGGGACAPLAFNLTRPSKGQLRMQVAALDPLRRYKVAVQGSQGVKDAFGLPLQGTETLFWSKALDSDFSGPTVSGCQCLFACFGYHLPALHPQ